MASIGSSFLLRLEKIICKVDYDLLKWLVLQYFRDYLTGVQIQGYALLSTALNHVGHHQAVHVLLELAMQRFKEQENILGDRHNDWFELVFKITVSTGFKNDWIRLINIV